MAVACSGGRDSMALLHATRAACAPLRIGVVALHVHHGLQPRADDWLEHVRRRCAAWKIGFAATRLDSRPARGASVEAWARRERYRALRTMALEQGASIVLLAHHRRDQAETFLLQALRGAGAAGLAAMPTCVRREGITWARPWLDVSREPIEAYLKRHRIGAVDDPSNADPRWARSRLRGDVWPVLIQAFGDAETTLAAAARHAAHAAALQDEVGREDLGQLLDGEALLLRPWQSLTPARRANALRAWLQRFGPVADSLLQRLIDEWPRSPDGSWPMAAGRLRARRGALAFVAALPSAPVEVHRLAVRRAGRYRVEAWGGHLDVKRVAQGGVAMARLAAVELRRRAGAERFQGAALRPPRSLKKQFQEAGVPAWQRDGPLLYDAAGALVYAAGLGIDARAVAAPGEAQVSLVWVPEAGR